MNKFILYLFAMCIPFYSCTQSSPSSNDEPQQVIHKALDAKDYYYSLENTKDKYIIDVRTPGEFESGFIKGAENIDIYSNDFQERLSTLEKNKPVFVYCKSGGRSGQAMEMMKSMGFQTVYNLQGGMMSWSHFNLPIAKTTDKEMVDEWSKEKYDELLASKENVLVDFYAEWCVPCQKLKPILEQIQNENPNLTVLRLDVEKSPQFVKDIGVVDLPTIYLYKKEKQTRYIGEWTKQGLDQFLKKNL